MNKTIESNCAVCGPIVLGKPGEMRSWTNWDECAFIVPVAFAANIQALGRAHADFNGKYESPDGKKMSEDFRQEKIQLIHGCADEWDYEKYPDIDAHKLDTMLCWTNE